MPKDLTGKILILKICIEIDRLVYIVYAIENDCQIAPVGAYKITP